MFWRSSGIRITLSVMALFVVASALIIGGIFWRTDDMLTRRNIQSVLTETKELSERAARDGEAGLLNELRTRRAHPGDMLYGLAAADGRPIWLDGIEAWPKALRRDNKTAIFEFTATAQPRPNTFRSTQSRPRAEAGRSRPHRAGRTAVAIGATLRLPDGGRLLVARDVTEQRQLAATVRRWLIAALAMMALLALGSAWAINRLLMSRMRSVSDTAAAILAGDMTRRVPLSANDDEFDALARQLNAMLERIANLMQGLQEVSDNIAHDLKTPLNRLRMRAEEALRDDRRAGAHREGLEATLIEADELIRTFNALLRVARLEAGTLGENVETFDVAALIEDLAEFYEPVVDEADAALCVETDGPIYLRADRQLISQALTNLLENALKYGLTGKARRIALGARLAAHGGGTELWVSDVGAGIKAGDHDRVLKRFVRLDEARSKPGTGLGLSLVAAVVRQHGGTMHLSDNLPGLKVTLHLPPERTTTNPVAKDEADSNDGAFVSFHSGKTVAET